MERYGHMYKKLLNYVITNANYKPVCNESLPMQLNKIVKGLLVTNPLVILQNGLVTSSWYISYNTTYSFYPFKFLYTSILDSYLMLVTIPTHLIHSVYYLLKITHEASSAVSQWAVPAICVSLGAELVGRITYNYVMSHSNTIRVNPQYH